MSKNMWLVYYASGFASSGFGSVIYLGDAVGALAAISNARNMEIDEGWDYQPIAVRELAVGVNYLTEIGRSPVELDASNNLEALKAAAWK